VYIILFKGARLSSSYAENYEAVLCCYF